MGEGNVEETVALADSDSVPVGSEKEQPLNSVHGAPKWSPFDWFRMLAEELHWSFVYGVVAVYGISQGLGGSIWRVGSDYYWKDVQQVQPSAAQFYQGITSIPWMIKPIWGLLTDVVPVAGYRRRPYFILSGILGVISMLTLSLHSKLHVAFALLAMICFMAGAAISDVTIDALGAQNSITHPTLAPDVQSLMGLSSSIGSLIGFSISGLLVHAIGSQGVLGLLSIPAILVLSVGLLLKEDASPSCSVKQVFDNFREATMTMWETLKLPQVWRPCFYMFLSLALSLNIQEGMFYWYTDTSKGLSFSEGSVGLIFAIGSVGSLLGVILYQNILKDYPFRGLLFWSQLLLSLSGMLDLVLVLRLNLKLGMPNYFFAVIDEGVSQLVNRLKWMPILVLSAKLCPPGIEGTFFALVMSIENVGLLTSSWGGGLLLHVLRVTRSEFSNLWAAILIRNLMRLVPLLFLFLVPKSDHNSTILPAEMLEQNNVLEPNMMPLQRDDIEMASLAEERASNLPEEIERNEDDSELVSLVGNT
ncbi:Major facilitator superfamily protein [Rhynchospora pubera]|uniref:Major facilitator superfamily protein n=1 Tax=Rhynchospora pubera TaxID=906938 RepID=A0AAV8HMD7_9POAL|nr:Major facilitator superfamily protein [Rhynchospora pubera]KAJ4816473.1 Major facilitator superfamily protein [Rhynchospora pubera]